MTNFHLPIIFLLCLISSVRLDDDEGRVEGYSKQKASVNIRRPRPRPAVPPPPSPAIQFAVQVQAAPSSVGDPCDDHSSDPCVCSLNDKCEFNEMTEKCISANSKFLDKLSCQRPNSFYAYSSSVLCKTSGAGDCNGGVAVYSVNFNGPSYRNAEGTRYRGESHVSRIDTGRHRVAGKAACKPTGVASVDDAEKLYRTFVEGNPELREPGSCVQYPVPLLQDGEYEVILNTVAGMGKCMDIKLGGATVAVNVDLMKLAENKECKTIDIITQLVVEENQRKMHIKGHQNTVEIEGGFSIKLCYAECDVVPQSVYRASAFSLVRYGADTEVFENKKITIMTYDNGRQIFQYEDIEVEKYRDVEDEASNPPPSPSLSSGKPSLPKLMSISRMRFTSEMKAKLRETCSALDDESNCKQSGCEYFIPTGVCDSAEAFCTGAMLGKVECFRGNSFYITGGVLCQTALQQIGTCEVGEVKFALNIGPFYRDPRGVEYETSDPSNLKASPNSEYVDLATAPGVKCKKLSPTKLGLGGRAAMEYPLYSSVVRAKGRATACLTFPIRNINNGAFEISIKTLEPFYDTAGKRAFNVKLNGQVILKNFDIASYVGSCYGLDIIIQFQVAGDVLIMTGFDEKKNSVRDNTINLSFCPGDDPTGSYPDLSYIVSAISLARLKVPGEDDNTPVEGEFKIGLKVKAKVGAGRNEEEDGCPQCSGFDGNPKACKNAGYEYNLATKACVKRGKDCTGKLEESSCQRKNVFYVHAGVPCKNDANAGFCTGAKNAHGLNLGGGAHEDSLGMKYIPEGKYGRDPEGTRQEGKLSDGCTFSDEISQNDAKDLFGSYISGKKGSKSGACIAYDFAICQEGTYELVLKTIETPGVKQRCFDIKIEDVPIMVGIDPSRLLDGSAGTCKPLELAFPITIENYGTPDNQQLTVLGIPDTIFLEKKLKLKLCNCGWDSPNPTYQASALSLTRFGEGTMACDACQASNGNERGCKEIGCDFDKRTSVCSAPVTSVFSSRCDKFDDANSCKQAGCEYNIVSNKCMAGAQDGGGICTDESMFTEYSNCRRPNVYYSNAGVLCLNQADTEIIGGCDSGKPIWALNVNGKDYSSKRGIMFAADDPLYTYDPMDLKVAINSAQQCSNEKDTPFLELYSTGVMGNPTKRKSGGCINFPFPICQDGNYEISVFLLNGHYSEVNKRCFDIKLNSATVAYAIDPARLGAGKNNNQPKKCQRSELIILFKVENSGTQLTPQGHTDSVPLDGFINLSMCYGKCGYADPVFVISGFSVMRFGEQEVVCDKCAIYNQNPVACEKDVCEYDAVKSKCTKSEGSQSCKKYSSDPCDCVAKGCRFDSSTEKCVVDDDVFQNKLACRRPRSYYAFSSKIQCKYPENDEAKASCLSGSTVYGVNANGKDYEDEQGLKYKGELAGMSVDPGDTRKEADTKGKLELPGISKADTASLYGGFVFGSPAKQKTGGILSYPVPITQDGEYELILKFVDVIYKQPKKRVFDIRINNVPVAVEVDISKLGGGNGSPQAVDISVLFLIQNSATLMQIKGHATPMTIFGGFHLQFAYGASGADATDKCFIFSAFNVIRFGDDSLIPEVVKSASLKADVSPVVKAKSGDACEIHGENANDCKMDGCEYDLVNKKCVHQSKECPETMFEEFSKCQRGGALYGNSGVLCRNKVNAGVCTGEVIHSVNLNGQDYYLPERQMPFAAEKPTDSQDPNGLRRASSISKFCPNENDDEFAKEVLMPSVFAMPQPGKEGCLTYIIPLKGQGEYEISILVVDGKYKAVNLRCFDVMLNSVPVLYGVDPYRLGGKACAKNELIILFKVVISGGPRLTPVGYTEPIPLKGNRVDLSFCLGKCSAPDNSFQISAFSVLKFGAAVVPTGNCKMYGSNADACKSAGCEFDIVNRKCIKELEDCNDELFSEFSNCRRNEADYAQAGMLCRNQKGGGGGTCNQKLVSAVNLNGQDYLYKNRNIQFKAETENDYKDPNFLRVSSSNEFSCKADKDEHFKQLLAPALYGELGFEGCVEYPLTVSEDGLYELSLFVIDNQQTVNSKCWDVRFNTATVLYGIDPARLNAGKECRRNELIIIFKVQSTATQLVPLGFTQPILIQGKTFDLNICMGTCSYTQDKSFQISAISLMQIGASSGGLTSSPDPYCGVHGSNANACRRAGCEYNLIMKQCMYKVKECSSKDFGAFPTCFRTKEKYINAGVLCRYTDEYETANLCHEKQIYAINLNGRDYKYDHNNLHVSFRGENSADFRNPENNRRTTDYGYTLCPERTGKFHESPLIDTHIWGGGGVWVKSNGDAGGYGGYGCLMYPIKLDGDGFYYLTLWTTEGHITEPFKACFDIKLSGVTVMYALDLPLLTLPEELKQSRCSNHRLNIPFKVEERGTKLYPLGFPNPIQISNSVDVTLCGGSCGYENQHFDMSAIHLMKILSVVGKS